MKMTIGVLRWLARQPPPAAPGRTRRNAGRAAIRRTRIEERRDLHRGWRAQLGHRRLRSTTGASCTSAPTPAPMTTSAQTQVVDLKGRMVVPGFQDVHIHPISGGHRGEWLRPEHGRPTSRNTSRRSGNTRKIIPTTPGSRAAAGHSPPSGRARPRGSELIDAVVPDRPVLLWTRDGHTTWVNSKALLVAGIRTGDTKAPPDGRIDRDPRAGEPSAPCSESPVGSWRLLPSRPPMRHRSGLRRRSAC